MMREGIGKYKAKDIDTGEWRYGNYLRIYPPNDCTNLSPDPKHVIVFKQFADWGMNPMVQAEVDPETVCEFTGHPQGIYEHDLVKARDGRLCEVVWDDQFCGFKLIACESKGGFRPYYALCSVDGIEKVGNVHDKEGEAGE